MGASIDKIIPTIKPNSKRKILWDLFIMLFILYKFFLIPIELCFSIKLQISVDPAFGLINFISSCFFIIDIFVKMNTGFYENGNVVLIKFKIFKHYFKSYLILDILASIHSGMSIYEYIYIDVNNSLPPSATWLHICFFFKLIKLNKIISNFEESVYMSETAEVVAELLKLLLKISYFSHLEACVWYAVPHFYNPPGQNWIEYGKMNDAYWLDRYLASLYWSVTALITTGFGEKVSPQNKVELIVGVVLLMMGGIVFGYTVKSIGEVIDKLKNSNQSFKAELRTLNRFMKEKKIGYELQDRARKYLHFFVRDRDNEQAQRVGEILNKFSFNLKEEIYLNTNGVILQKFPLLSENFSKEFLKKIVFLMNQVTFIPEETIYLENDWEDRNLYLITEGAIQIYYESPKKLSVLKKMSVIQSLPE